MAAAMEVTHSPKIKLRKYMIPELWVKHGLLEFGRLPDFPSVELDATVLKMIWAHSKSSGPNFFPHITFQSWIRICQFKINLDIEVGWMYFRLFDIICQQILNQEKGVEEVTQDTKHLSTRRTSRGSDSEVTVPTLEFLLFLYIQHLTRIQKNNEQKKTPELKTFRRDAEEFPFEWPNSPVKEVKFIIGEEEHVDFVKANIEEIIKFLQLISDESTTRTSVEIVSALNFIFIGVLRAEKGCNVLGVEDFLGFECVRKSLDFHETDKTVDRQRLINWIIEKIKPYPLGSTCCLANAAHSGFKTGLCLNKVDEVSQYNKIGTNRQPPPHGWFIISQVNQQVFCEFENVIPFSNMKIYRCNQSNIYTPMVLTHVSIEKCKNTTIYLGCIGKILKIVDCKDCTFTGMARQIIIHDCIGCQFNFHSPSYPTILSGTKCSKLTFGPHATTYPKLEEHMKLARLPPHPSQYAAVKEINRTLSRDGRRCWEKLKPQNFTQIVFPFEMKGETKNNPIPLPNEFVKYKVCVNNRFQQWRVQVKTLDKTHQDLSRETMHARFKEFVEGRGYDGEVQGLQDLLRKVRSENVAPVWPPFSLAEKTTTPPKKVGTPNLETSRMKRAVALDMVDEEDEDEVFMDDNPRNEAYAGTSRTEMKKVEEQNQESVPFHNLLSPPRSMEIERGT